jgi:hypothetical protein
MHHQGDALDFHLVTSTTEADDIEDEACGGDVPLVDISQRIKQYHSAASPAVSRSDKKPLHTPTHTDQKKKMRRRQMSDIWINTYVGRGNPPTVSDGEEEILSPSLSGHGRRKLKIPSWVKDNNSGHGNSLADAGAATAPAAPLPPPHSFRAMRSASSVCRHSAGSEDSVKSPSINRRRLRGRRIHESSWIKKDEDDNRRDDQSMHILKSLDSNNKVSVQRIQSISVPLFAAHSEKIDHHHNYDHQLRH